MEVFQNYSLKAYNTFGINVSAQYFATFGSREELETLVATYTTVPKLILGGGSNLLFLNDYAGLVLKNDIDFIEVTREDDQGILIKAGAGVNWHHFVMYCVNNNYGGVENLSLIPGNVGASPMQNIGAYGVEIKDVFYELEAFDLNNKTVRIFSAAECAFGYRESVFKRQYRDQYVILNVTFFLSKNPVFNTGYGAVEKELEVMKVKDLSVQAISEAIIRIRTSKLPDPRLIGNAGSFFKNPVVLKEQYVSMQEARRREQTLKNLIPDVPFYKVDEEHYKIPAAWLIEQCGWKGFRRGDAGCYPNQPLVLVNYGSASGREVYNLSSEIMASVKEKFGIILEREVNII